MGSARKVDPSGFDGPDKVQEQGEDTWIDHPAGGTRPTAGSGSPHARARVKNADSSAASKMPGVRAALALADPGDPAKAAINYPAEEVAAVAATTEELAEDAIRAIEVEDHALPPPFHGGTGDVPRCADGVSG